MAKLVTKVLSVRFHRNGVSGNGFHVVHFESGRGKNKQTMIGTVFGYSDDPEIPMEYGNCAVIDLADVTQRWRGDHYEAELHAAIKRAPSSERHA
jgi:hypothetical protein